MILDKKFKIRSGFLISIEGIDGSGKSTLAKNIYHDLVNKNFDVICTKEPGATNLGKLIRNIIQNRDFEIDSKAEYLLFAADRAQHIKEFIIPELNKNKIIISDRFADSSLAYQGYGRKINLDIINIINSWSLDNIVPNLTFYLKIDYQTALKRLKSRENLNNQNLSYFDKQKEEFFINVINGFNKIFSKNPNAIILDATKDTNFLKNQALDIILNKFKELK